MIWNIANALSDYFKPHGYSLMILPMTVGKRFHNCLFSAHAAVQEQYEKESKSLNMPKFFQDAVALDHYGKMTYEKVL